MGVGVRRSAQARQVFHDLVTLALWQGHWWMICEKQQEPASKVHGDCTLIFRFRDFT